MKLILTALILVSLALNIFPQQQPGARQIALANSDVALSNDVFSIFNNPSGLALLTWREIGLYYSPSPFGLKELANGFVAYSEPFSFGTIAIGGMTYGFELYRENKFSAAYSFKYSDRFFAGIGINYHSVTIEKYGNTGSLYFNAGGLIYITTSFRWGFSFHNINRATFGEEKNQIPSVISTGLSYDINEEVSLNSSIHKDLQFNPELSFGVEYDIIKYLSLRSGFSNEPEKYSFGVGIHYANVNFDYSLFTHQDLGLTHQAGIIISFGLDQTRKQIIRENLKLE